MKAKRIMGFFLSLVMFTAYLPLNPIASYADGDGVKIDDTNFPDKIFREYVSDNFDKNKDGILSSEECDNIKDISINVYPVQSLKGIEHFENLTELNCSNNYLESLNLSKNTKLTSLNCERNNYLEELDVSKNTELTKLYCNENDRLGKLDITKNTKLTTLYCNNTRLKKLNVDNNTALTSLNCGSNQLTSLNVDKNTALTSLNCGSNQLTSLNVDKNTALISLNCESNQLTSLNVDKNTALTSLNCESNYKLEKLGVSNNTKLTELDYARTNLKELDVSKNTELTKLHCNENDRLEKLDLSNNTKLKELNCARTKLTSLDLSKNIELTVFHCYNTKLTSLDLRNNTKLTVLDCDESDRLEKLDLSKNTELKELYCARTKLTSLDLSNNTKLIHLECYENQLKGLDLSKNTELKELNCNNTKLTNLDLSQNKELTDLNCSQNKLEKLDLSNNTKLTHLECYENQLKGLDLSKNTELKELNCNNTKLTNLDLSQNKELTDLNCSQNKLEKLDVSGNLALKKLNCSQNNLGKLELTKNKELTDLNCSQNKLEKLDVSGDLALTDLNCSQNKLEKLDLSNNTELSYLFGDNNPFISVKLSDEDNSYKSCSVVYTVEVEKGSKKIPFDKLPKGFYKNRIKPNVKLEEDGFTWDGKDNPIKFSYQLYENPNGVVYDEFVDAEITVKEKEVPVPTPTDKKVIGPVDPKDPNSEKPADVSKYWTVTFETEDETKGTVSAKNTVYVLKTETKTLADITAPEVTAKEGYEFDKWEPALTNATTINKDLKVKAHFKQKVVPVPTPTDKKVIGPVDPTDPNGGKPADASKYYTVTFETEDETKGTVSAKNTVYVLKTETKTLADITAPEVTAKEGYEFDKWEPALTNATTINKDLKVKAHFKQKVVPVPTPTDPKVVGPVDPQDPNSEKPADASKYYTVTFETEDETKGTVSAKNTVYVLKTETKTLADITAPEVTAKEGYEFDKWNPALTNATTINKDMKVTAYFKATGIPTPTDKKVIGPVDPQDPNSEKPADTSKYYTVTFETEDETKGTVDDKNTVYVLKTERKTLADITAPKVTAKDGYEFDKWEPTLDKNTAIDRDLKVKAHFKQKEVPVPTPTDKKVIGPVDPQDPNGGKPADTSKYWTVTFETEDETKGTVDAKNTVYVLKTERKTLADITAPEVTAKEGYEFDKWNPALTNATTINKDMKVTAYFKATGIPTPTDKKVIGPVDPKDPNGGKPADTSKYYTVTFETEDETKGTVDAKNTVYVLKTERKTLADITAPKVTAKDGYEFDKWEPTLDKNTAIDRDLKVKAHFKQKEVPVPTPTDKKVIGPVDPQDPNGGKPADTSKYFTVTFETEDETKGTVSAKNTVYVLKTERKTLADITAPETTAKEGYEFDKWEPTLDKNTAIDKNLTVKAHFKQKVVPVPTPTDPKVVGPVIGPVDPQDPNDEKPADASKYWTVTFETEDETKGTVDAKNTVYVLKTETKTLADITAPEVTAKEGYEFDKWEPTLDKNTAIDKDLTVKAHFKKVKEKSYNKKQQVANNSKMPKTANSMNIELYTVFMILSVALLVIAVKKRKES